MRRTLPLLGVLFFLSAGRAQEEEVGRPYWITTDSEASAALRSAAAAVANEGWREAAEKLNEIFVRFPERFSPTTRRAPYVGVRRRATQLLAQAPLALRAYYEERYGPQAETALRGALAAGDRRELLEIVRGHEATQAGLRAILALADSALLRGRPAEARLLLARLERLHPEAARRPDIEKRAALAARRDHADGGPPPFAADGDAGPTPLLRDAWPMIGGDAPRTRIAPPVLVRPIQSEIEVQIHERLWDTPPRPTQGFRLDRRRFSARWEELWRGYVPIHPVIARGFLVYHDGRQVFSVNLYSGEEHWRFPDAPEVEHDEGRTNLSTLLSPAVADGVVYAAVEAAVPYVPQRLQNVPITYYIPRRRLVALDLETGRPLWRHDDESLADSEGGRLLSRLSIIAPPLVRGDRIYVPAALSQGTFHIYLVAVERRTGRLVYATPISNGQQELNLFGRQLNECAATPVAEADGVLYFGTNLGIVAAVDALLGTPLWAASYEIQPIPSTYLWFEAPRRWPHFDNGPPLVSGKTVLTAPTDGKDLLALHRETGRVLWRVDHDGRLAGLDFAIRTVHGCDDDHVYVSGPGGVAALHLEDGEGEQRAGSVSWKWSAWNGELDQGAGRGIVAQNGLWLPTYGWVYRFDRATGRVLDRTARGAQKEESGADANTPVNLVWGDGVLVTAGREYLCARYDRNDVIALAKARIARRPHEIGPILAAADTYLATGSTSLAIAHYRRARTRADAEGVPAAAARAAEGLFRALMAQARETLLEAVDRAPAEFEAAFRAAPGAQARLRARVRLETILDERARSPEREWRLRNLRSIERDHGEARVDGADRPARIWALRRMAAILVDGTDGRAALEVLQQLIEADPTGSDGRFAAAEMRTLLERKGRALYEPYERRARKLFAAALSSGDLEALERGILVYPNASAADGATLELARRRLQADDPAAATQVLQRFLLDRQGSPHTPDALLLLVRALHRRGSFGPAFSALHRLRQRHAEALVHRADGARVPAREVADAWLERDPYATIAHSARRRDLEPGLVERFEKDFPSEAFVDAPDLLGERPPELAHAVLLKAGTRVYALDATGRELYQLLFGDEEPSGPLVFVGRNLLAVTSRRVLVFDAVTGRARVGRQLPGRGLRLLESQGQVFLLYRQGGMRGPMAVAALNPADATTLWSRVVPTEGDEETVVARHALAIADRLVLFSENPVALIALDSTSGALENRVPIHGGSRSRLAVAPVRLPDGRLVVGLGTRERRRRFAWEHSYEIVLVDPSRPGEAGVAWRYVAPRDEQSRYPRQLQVQGEHVTMLDESRGASVVRLSDGESVRFVPRLFVTEELEARAHLTANQPRHESLLLVLTGPTRREPARLTAYAVPELGVKYSVPAAAAPHELAESIDTDGVLGISVIPQEQAGTRARIRLLDPLTGAALQEIVPAGRRVNWFTARVQNGILVVTTAANTAYGFGPK